MVTIVGAGIATITANQPGDDNYNAAQVAQADLTVNQAIQTITFITIDPKKYGDAPFDLTATATSGLAVSFTSSDETVATISGSTVTILKADTVVFTASQPGNENYNPATSVPQDLVINKATLTVIPDNKAIVYGDALPAFTFTYSGFIGSDDASAIDVLPIAGTRIIEGRRWQI